MTTAEAEDQLEIRIAPVMTGGVSLAVWMGGVTCELYRAVSRDGVYAELLDRMDERVVVDVITGTSAGGLNGVLLAAALALRLKVEDFKHLRDVWLDDGSIGDLLRSPFDPDPASLLKGDDHFLKRIRHHLDNWYRSSGVGPRSAQPPNSVEGAELVLLVTATLLSGEPEPFVDDFGQPINQSTHEALFTFRGADLVASTSAAQLALAARTSASFPGAFEPSYCPVNEVGPTGQPDVAGIASFSRSRYAIDGGVLRNLPLGPAVDAVFRQPAQSETRRLLAYVNPDPPPPLDEPADVAELPALAPVVAASLVSLPRHESVSAHLREIKAHNRRVRQQQESRRNILRVVGDVDEAANRVYEDFKNRRIEDSVRGTSAQVVRRALRLSVDEQRALDAEAELKKGAAEPRLWFPKKFPTTGFASDEHPEQAPWPWGIAPLEYAGSLLIGLLRRALGGARDGETRTRIRALRGEVGAAIKALGAVRAVDDAYWAVRTALLADEATDIPAWAIASYEQWPLIDDDTRKNVLRQRPPLVERYDARLAELTASGVTAQPFTPLASRQALHDVAVRFASAAWAARAELESLAARDADARLLVDAILGGVSARGHEKVIVRRLLTLFVVQVAVGGAESPREQVVELLQVSSHVCHAIDATQQRGSAVGKLTGIGLHHFAAFFKRSWRANDWMWGRLDGADRLALALLDPQRLRTVCGDADEAYGLVRSIAVGGGGDREALDASFDADGIRREIDAAFQPGAADRSLPRSAQAIARRMHVEILREELPAVAEAVRRSEDAGGALTERGAAFLRAADAAVRTSPPASWSPKVLEDLLAACRVGEETVTEELASDAMTLSTAQAAAVTASALRGGKSGLGAIRNVMRSVRSAVLLVYALVRAAVTGGPVGTMVIAGGLAAGGTVVGLGIAGADVDGTWMAFSIVLLAVWSVLAVVTSGSLLVALPLLAMGAVAVAFNGDRLADAMVAPASGWRKVVVDDAGISGRVVAGVFAVAMLVTIASFWSSIASRGWRRWGVAVRFVVIVAFALLTLWAKAKLPGELPRWLADPSPSPRKQEIIDWLGKAHSYRIVAVATVLPAGALLLEALRRLPRGIQRAAWVVRSSRLEPPLVIVPPSGSAEERFGKAVLAVLAVTAGTALVAAIAWLPDGADDILRSVLGVFAAAFLLFPRHEGTPWSRWSWLVAGIDRRSAPASTRFGGRFGAALSIPLAIAWAAGLFGAAPGDDADLPAVLLHCAVIVVGVACLEEVLFRGIALRALAFNGNAATGVVLSSIAFGVSHVVSASEQWDGPAGVAGVVVFTTLAGLLFSWLHLRTKHLVAPVLVHAGVNLAAYLAVVTS